MGEKRERKWMWLLFAIPLLAVALSIQYFMRKQYPDNPGDAAMRPSAFKSGGEKMAKGKPQGKNRGVAAQNKDTFEAQDDADEMDSKDMVGYGTGSGYSPVAGKKPKARLEATSDVVENPMEGATVEKMAGVKMSTGASATAMNVMKGGESTMASASKAPTPQMLNARANLPDMIEVRGKAAGKNSCSSIEYRGEGPEFTQVSKNEWTKVVNNFHELKGIMLTWLQKKQKEIPEKTMKVMESQIRTLRVHRPPTLDEPEMSWRGIGTWVQETNKPPMVKLGGGFIKLMNKQPARAKFEMARLMLQGWAPCELQRLGGGEAWAPMLKCMNVTEQQACGAGTYSEGGWAISSALAYSIANPGCSIDGLSSDESASCMKKVPMPLTLSDNLENLEKSWKEARR